MVILDTHFNNVQFDSSVIDGSTGLYPLTAQSPDVFQAGGTPQEKWATGLVDWNQYLLGESLGKLMGTSCPSV